MESEVGLVAAPVGRDPVPGDGRRGTALALAKLVGRVEWVAGNAALSGARASSLEIPPVRVMIETVAETLRRCAALICDGTAHPVHDPGRVSASCRNRRGGWPSWSTPRSTTRCPSLIDLQAAADEPIISAEGGGADHLGGIASSLDPGFQARTLGFATTMVAAATLEAAGVAAEGDRGFGLTGDPPAVAALAAAGLASLLPLRVVPQRGARQRGTGIGGDDRRGH